MRKYELAFLGLSMMAAAGCGSSGNPGFGVGGAQMCAQVSPCGGDLTGTWTFTAGCITGLGIKDATGSSSSACPGESIGVTAVSVSGTATFNADMTYVFTALREQGTYSLSVPGSCLNGASCSDVSTALQSTGEFESATCTGSGGCSCTAVQNPAGGSETGTYSISGNLLTTVPSTGSASTVPYCVKGTTLHLIETSTMNMGAMGQAAIDEDTIAIKQ